MLTFAELKSTAFLNKLNPFWLSSRVCSGHYTLSVHTDKLSPAQHLIVFWNMKSHLSPFWKRGKCIITCTVHHLPKKASPQVCWVSSGFFCSSTPFCFLTIAESRVQWRVHRNAAADGEQGEHSLTGTYQTKMAGTVKRWRNPDAGSTVMNLDLSSIWFAGWGKRHTFVLILNLHWDDFDSLICCTA